MRAQIEKVVEGVARILEATAVASTVSTGDYVKWKASRGSARGKVVSIHTSSKVPNVAHELVGTSDAPAARVRIYAKSGNGWVPTDTYVPLPATALSTTDALAEPSLTESVDTAGSFDDIRAKVRAALCDRIQAVTGTPCTWVYVMDIGPDWAVYELNDGDLFLVNYAIDAANAVTLTDAEEVYRRTVYVPADDTGDDGTAAVTEANDRITGRLLGAKGTNAAGGRVFGVRILAYGDSKNGIRYTESVMRPAVPLYEGAKAYDHHRTPAELASSTLAGLVGTYRNVEATSEGIDAELHLLPGATHVAEALDASLANQEAGLAPLVGISHDVAAQRKSIIAGGRRLQEATQIVAVNSADVVADPSAGGQATRMVAGGIGTESPQPKGHTLNLKQLLALLRTVESAQRATLLAEHASVLESAGITADDAIRMAEATEPAATSTGDRLTESYGAASTVGRMLVERAIAGAKLGDHMVEAVIGELPDRFTEADLTTKVASFVRITEGLEKQGLKPTVRALEGVTTDEHDKKVARLDATFAGDFGKGYRSFKEAYADITGKTPKAYDSEDFNRQVLRESVTIHDSSGMMREYDSTVRTQESVDSTTWGNVLGDSITRRTIADYEQPSLQAWQQVVSSIVPVNDFRTQRIERMGGFGVLPTVLQGAPYQPLTSPGNDSEVTYAITKKGGTEDLTLETIANDDLRAVLQIPKKLGLAAAQTLYRFVFDLFIAPPTIYDSVALFHATHSNTASTTLSDANLRARRKAMRVQAGYGDTYNILSLTPKYVLVPSTLEALAWQLCTSAVAVTTSAPEGAASNIPNIHQGMTPIVVDYWEGTSSSAWYVVADPAMCPTIELGFYQGRRDPELFVQNDPLTGSVFTADKVTFKIRHIYSGAVLDYRGLQRGNS